MKVLSYLELDKPGINNIPQKDYNLWKKWLYKIFQPDYAFKFEDFYSQPFKPEMITELFEGWEISEANSERSEYHEKINLRYGKKDKDWAMIEYWYSKDKKDFFYISYGILDCFLVKENKFLFPRTLDNFITDCQRTNIKLIWKMKE
jgi:hypothetical protein